jgi:hypothetical protein
MLVKIRKPILKDSTFYTLPSNGDVSSAQWRTRNRKQQGKNKIIPVNVTKRLSPSFRINDSPASTMQLRRIIR